MAIKHSRQGIALGAVAALGVTMLGASPAFATGDGDLILSAVGNGVTHGTQQGGMLLALDWKTGVDTSKFDSLKWHVISATDEDGDDVDYESSWSEAEWEDKGDVDPLNDEVDYGIDTSYDLGEEYFVAPWAGLIDDNDPTTDDAWDGTDEEYVEGGSEDGDFVYSELLETEFALPWFGIAIEPEDVGSCSTYTFEVQAFVDKAPFDNKANNNEVRSNVVEVVLHDAECLTGRVSAKSIPGWFDPKLAPTITVNQKLNDYSPFYSYDEGAEAWTYEVLSDQNYALALQQVAADGNDPFEFYYWPLFGEYVKETKTVDSEAGWEITSKGAVAFRADPKDTGMWYYTKAKILSDFPPIAANKGSKSNRIFLTNFGYDMGPDTTAWTPTIYRKASNTASFGYIAESKIVRKNGTAKMYAFDILGAGRVEFLHNGKRVSSIDMVDAYDTRAREQGNRPYFVRDVKLVRGKNVLEVRVDGKTVKRHTYTVRAGMA